MNKIENRRFLQTAYRQALIAGCPPDEVALVYSGGYGWTGCKSTALNENDRLAATKIAATGRVPLVIVDVGVYALDREWLSRGIGVS